MALCGEFAPDVVHSQLELADVVGQMVAMKFHLPHVITFQNTHWWAVRNVASHWRIAYRKYWLRSLMLWLPMLYSIKGLIFQLS